MKLHQKYSQSEMTTPCNEMKKQRFKKKNYLKRSHTNTTDHVPYELVQ